MPAGPSHLIPGSDFETRRKEYLHCCGAHATGGRTGFFSQIARLELGLDVDEARVLGFKYWWDEAQGDNRRCGWTENHQIIFRAEFGARSYTIRHRDLAHVIDLTTTELTS